MKQLAVLLAGVLSVSASATSVFFDMSSTNTVWYYSVDEVSGETTDENYTVDIGDFQSRVDLGSSSYTEAYEDVFNNPNGDATSYFSSLYLQDVISNSSDTPGLAYLRTLDLTGAQTSWNYGVANLNQRFTDYTDPGTPDYGDEYFSFNLQYSGVVEEMVGLDTLRTTVNFNQYFQITTGFLDSADAIGPLTESDFWDQVQNSTGNSVWLSESYGTTYELCDVSGNCEWQGFEDYSISSYGNVISPVNVPAPSAFALMLLPALWLRRKLK